MSDAYGLGIAILPRASTELELEEKLLIEIPITGYEFPVYTQIAYHKDKWISL
jgi:DNA-binding transcriptional LysR family regulator